MLGFHRSMSEIRRLGLLFSLVLAVLFGALCPLSPYGSKQFSGQVQGATERRLCSPRLEVHWSAYGALAFPKKSTVKVSPSGEFAFSMPETDSVDVYVFDDCHFTLRAVLTADSDSSQTFVLEPLPELRVTSVKDAKQLKSFEVEVWKKHNPLWPDSEESLADVGMRTADSSSGEVCLYLRPFLYRVRVFELSNGARTGRIGEEFVDISESDTLRSINIPIENSPSP